MTKIAGKAAVVTGGGGAIGSAVARELAREGASVAVVDILPEYAERVAAEIVAEGGRAVAIACDVCDRGSIKAMAAEATAALGPIGLVFANAGATSFDPLVEMSDDDVEWIVQANLMGVIGTVRAFLPDMIAGGGGHLIATSSIAGLIPGMIAVHVPYSAAKMGVIGFMMNVALELKQHNIRTTTYCPGGVASAMMDNNARYRPDRFGGPTEAQIHVPTQSFADAPPDFHKPETIAPMVLEAVRNDRAFVFDHAKHRQAFIDLYANIVLGGFDDLEAWQSRHGIPAYNTEGARWSLT